MKQTVQTVETITVTSVDVGDVFQFLKESGCRKVGELLVVMKGITNSRDIEFVHASNLGGNYGSLEWLSEEINAGNLQYLGKVDTVTLGVCGPAATARV